jgi:hypothetical protein
MRIPILAIVAALAAAILPATARAAPPSTTCPAEQRALDSAFEQDRGVLYAKLPTRHAEIDRVLKQVKGSLNSIVPMIMQASAEDLGDQPEVKVMQIADKGIADTRDWPHVTRALKPLMLCALHSRQAELRGGHGAPRVASRPATTSSSAQASAASGGESCVTMEPKPNSNGFWLVVNHCQYRASGTFCYVNGGTLGCDNAHPPSFGPIDPGRSGMVSGAPKSAIGANGLAVWRVSTCDYDLWVKGRCKPAPFR